MIKIFIGGGGGGGGGDWGGGSSERCLKWGSGVIPYLSKISYNRVWVKAKVVCRGKGVLMVSPPLPPENFNCTQNRKN